MIYSQIKAQNGPLFHDGAKRSISVSFRDMKLIRKGQRVSELQESWRAFSLSGVAVTVLLCSSGRIKNSIIAIDFFLA